MGVCVPSTPGWWTFYITACDGWKSETSSRAWLAASKLRASVYRSLVPTDCFITDRRPGQALHYRTRSYKNIVCKFTFNFSFLPFHLHSRFFFHFWFFLVNLLRWPWERRYIILIQGFINILEGFHPIKPLLLTFLSETFRQLVGFTSKFLNLKKEKTTLGKSLINRVKLLQLMEFF